MSPTVPPSRARVSLLGVPTDINSSFQRGSAAGPAAVRNVMNSGVGNLATESGDEFGAEIDFVDAGDVDVREDAGDADRITTAVRSITDSGRIPMVVGGDHSITFPVVRALAAVHGALNILHIDAHSDLYADFEGNPRSHASPFARILEAGLAARLVQVGIRTLNRHQREQASRFGVEITSMDRFSVDEVPVLGGPLYISVDLDGFDPAYAPGVSHHEPGGLSTRQVLDLLHVQHGTLVGSDVVELNPSCDPQGITAALAVKMVKELSSLAARSA